MGKWIYKFKPFLLNGILFLQLFSCEEIVENPSLESAPPRLVVDAWLTNQPRTSFVKLTNSQPYNQQNIAPTVSNAIISITDEDGTQMSFIEKEMGTYYPENEDYKGEEGKTYRLKVEVDEKVYSATSTMPNAIPIDSLSFQERVDDPIFQDGVYVTAHFQDPPFINNYYYWLFWVDEMPFDDGLIHINSDQNLDGIYFNFEFFEPVEFDQLFEVELYMLSKPAYDYYRGLSLLTDIGTANQISLENPVTNLSNNALGFFAASTLTKASIQIVE